MKYQINIKTSKILRWLFLLSTVIFTINAIRVAPKVSCIEYGFFALLSFWLSGFKINKN